MESKRSLARVDVIFAVAACVLAVVLFQSSEFGALCQGSYRFRSLPAFNLMPAQVWMKIGVLTALIIPGIVYAIGLYRYFGRLDLLDRFLGVTLAHGVTGIPYVVITVSTALAAFDPRLE